MRLYYVLLCISEITALRAKIAEMRETLMNQVRLVKYPECPIAVEIFRCCRDIVALLLLLSLMLFVLLLL